MDWAVATMSRERFKFISTNVTFDDINARAHKIAFNRNDKFHKMSEVFEIIRSNCCQAFDPGKYLCVDEELYSFRGHCNFRQFMPSKPSRYGIKIGH